MLRVGPTVLAALWVLLLLYGVRQHTKLSEMQEQLDSDLETLGRQRDNIKKREQTLRDAQLALDATIANRTDEAGRCAVALDTLARKCAEATKRSESCEGQRRTLLATVVEVQNKLATSEQLVQNLKSPQAAHVHAAPVTRPPVVLKPFPIANVTAPPFLEPLVEDTVFFRDATKPNLMPLPSQFDWGGQWMSLDTVAAPVTVHWALTSPVVDAAVARLRIRLAVLRNAVQLPSEAAVIKSGVALTVRVECNATSWAADWVPAWDMAESYRISVAPTGEVLVTAAEVVGVLRAFATIAQMSGYERGSGRRFFPAAPCIVADRPDVVWRGVLLDVARNFHPLEQVLSLLDGMEFVKLNVLHFHLSDDQGFRMESKVFPRLHEVASGGEYFTQEQIRLIVREAAARGIRVVPEFDMPAHAGAFLLAYPELAVRNTTVPTALPTSWGVLPWVLDATASSVYEWVERFFAEVIPFFPDPFFHIGGDEVPQGAWTDPLTTLWMRNHTMHNQHELQLYFNQRVGALLARHKRRMVGWDEILTPALPKDVVVQLWRSWVGGLDTQVRSLGLKSISSMELYLDWVRPAKHYYKQTVMSRGGGDDVGRLGGEACMWSEWASHNVDNRLWPTLAVVAERLWGAKQSPAASSAPMYGRLFGISHALARIGVRHEAVYEVALAALLTGRPYTYADVIAAASPSPSPPLPSSSSSSSSSSSTTAPSLRSSLSKDIGNATTAAAAAGVSVVSPDALALVRRLANSLQPVNRVGGGAKHDLVTLVDALRPDSFEMRALALLLDHVVTVDKFQDSQRVGLLLSYLRHYTTLSDGFAQAPLALSTKHALLMNAAPFAASISRVAQGAVTLLEALSKADTALAQRTAAGLLQLVAQVEDAKFEGNGVIIEFAHVVETHLCRALSL